MNELKFYQITSAVFGLLFIALVGISIGELTKIRELKSQAVEHGYAAYDAKTGNFHWLDKKEQ